MVRRFGTLASSYFIKGLLFQENESNEKDPFKRLLNTINYEFEQIHLKMNYIYERQDPYHTFDYEINQNPSNGLFIKFSDSFFDLSEIVNQKGLEEILNHKEIISDEMYIPPEKALLLVKLVPQIPAEHLQIPNQKAPSSDLDFSEDDESDGYEYGQQRVMEDYEHRVNFELSKQNLPPIFHILSYSELLQKESNENKGKQETQYRSYKLNSLNESEKDTSIYKDQKQMKSSEDYYESKDDSEEETFSESEKDGSKRKDQKQVKSSEEYYDRLFSAISSIQGITADHIYLIQRIRPQRISFIEKYPTIHYTHVVLRILYTSFRYVISFHKNHHFMH